MSAARTAAAFAVFSGFALFGAVSNSRKRQKVKEAKILLADASELESRIKTLRQPLADIAEAFSVNSGCAGFWGGISKGLSAGLSPEAAFDRAKSMISSDEVRNVLAELFEGLGSSELNGELRRLELAVNRLEQVYAETQKSLESGTKLTNSLSILMGLAAALLIL